MNIPKNYYRLCAEDSPILQAHLQRPGWANSPHHLSRTDTLIFNTFKKNLHFSYWFINGQFHQCIQSNKNGRESNLAYTKNKKNFASGAESVIQQLMDKSYAIAKPKGGYDDELIDIISKVQDLPHVLQIIPVAKYGDGEINRLIMPRLSCTFEKALSKLKQCNDTRKPNILHRIFIQIGVGLAGIHSKGVCHSDIKWTNILVDSNLNAFISDFGISKFFSDDTMKNQLLYTFEYAAPEVILSMIPTHREYIEGEIELMLENHEEELIDLLTPIINNIDSILKDCQSLDGNEEIAQQIVEILERKSEEYLSQFDGTFNFHQAMKVDMFAFGILMKKAEKESGIHIPGLAPLYRSLLNPNPKSRPNVVNSYKYLQTLLKHPPMDEQHIEKFIDNPPEEIKHFPAHLVDTIIARLGPSYTLGFAFNIRVNALGQAEQDSVGTLRIKKKV